MGASASRQWPGRRAGGRANSANFTQWDRFAPCIEPNFLGRSRRPLVSYPVDATKFWLAPILPHCPVQSRPPYRQNLRRSGHGRRPINQRPAKGTDATGRRRKGNPRRRQRGGGQPGNGISSCRRPLFGAGEMIPVRSAHLAADAESLRDFGSEHLESYSSDGARFSIPTTINAGAADLDRPGILGQRPIWHRRTARICDALSTMGAHMCHTCVTTSCSISHTWENTSPGAIPVPLSGPIRSAGPFKFRSRSGRAGSRINRAHTALRIAP